MTRASPFVALLLFGCGANVDLGGSPDSSALDAGALDGTADATRDAQACGTLSPPDSSAACNACDRTAPSCQPNGCFNGYYCDSVKRDCHAPPIGCEGDSSVFSASDATE